MLAIDDIKKLAKMQEVLLERTTNDREANLEKYKNTVIQIDEYDFSNLCAELNQVNDHNQTLEEELMFLEQVKSSYQQLLEQQLGFKRVCELYGDGILQLSDLSQIDIEYIEDRINTINGYLINKKNIEINKNKLQELSEQLISEENNKNLLSKRLLEFEEVLRDNFIKAEGRCIVSGQLQYISVISEYSKLGYDFRQLLKDNASLEMLLSTVNDERVEIEEKLRTAEICYNNAPSVDSKQILDDISIEDLKVKYRLTLLKIIELLSKNYDNYDLFKEKREQLLDLIKYRLNCIGKLGLRISIDPFSRTKVSEQLDTLLSLKDNSKVIKKVKKEITALDQRLEEMVSQNSVYMVQLNNTKDLMISRTSINDIDISGVNWDVEDYFVAKAVLDNQVVAVRVLPGKFNSDIVSQKTRRVIKRVNEMVNSISVKEDKTEIVAPELVIVPQSVVVEDKLDEEKVGNKQDASFDETNLDDSTELFSIMTDVTKEEDKSEENHELDLSVDSDNVNQDFGDSLFDYMQDTIRQEEVQRNNDDEKMDILDTFDADIFKSVDPFLETPLFTDRTDEEVKSDMVDERDSSADIDDVIIEAKNGSGLVGEEIREIVDSSEMDSELEDKEELDEEMPEAFWVTQGEEDIVEKDNIVPSFDEQIDALLSDENDTKTRKLVA